MFLVRIVIGLGAFIRVMGAISEIRGESEAEKIRKKLAEEEAKNPKKKKKYSKPLCP